ncbi:MAG: LysR family transcriptional regulator [Caulobacter sp.]|nr:LysR family transcriptional regulator [Caulobacter sp.]
MREVNLASVDLNLLPPLEALLRRRNVTRAAADVGLSQPAMSRALGRLRDLLGDPLLIRQGGGLAPTPFAEALVPQLATALGDLKGLFRRPAFDPRAETRTIRLVASDIHTVLLVPPLAARLARQAPGLTLRIEAYSPDLPIRMTRGEVDLTFAVTGAHLPPGAVSAPIARDSMVVAMRKGHPASAGPLTLAGYAGHSHVGVSLFGDGQSLIDSVLAAEGLERRIALTTPSFVAALAAVAAGDGVTAVSRTLAARFVDALGLHLAAAPFPGGDYEMTLVWASHRGSDALLAWLRDQISEIAGEVFAAG